MFADHIRNARNEAGMTQAALAKACGLDAAQISHYESGERSPSAENLFVLANALNCSVDRLAGRDCGYDVAFRAGYFQCREDMKIATRTRLSKIGSRGATNV